MAVANVITQCVTAPNAVKVVTVTAETLQWHKVIAYANIAFRSLIFIEVEPYPWVEMPNTHMLQYLQSA